MNNIVLLIIAIIIIIVMVFLYIQFNRLYKNLNIIHQGQNHLKTMFVNSANHNEQIIKAYQDIRALNNELIKELGYDYESHNELQHDSKINKDDEHLLNQSKQNIKDEPQGKVQNVSDTKHSNKIITSSETKLTSNPKNTIARENDITNTSNISEKPITNVKDIQSISGMLKEYNIKQDNEQSINSEISLNETTEQIVNEESSVHDIKPQDNKELLKKSDGVTKVIAEHHSSPNISAHESNDLISAHEMEDVKYKKIREYIMKFDEKKSKLSEMIQLAKEYELNIIITDNGKERNMKKNELYTFFTRLND